MSNERDTSKSDTGNSEQSVEKDTSANEVVDSTRRRLLSFLSARSLSKRLYAALS